LDWDKISEIHLVSERLEFISDSHPKLKLRPVPSDVGVSQDSSITVNWELTLDKLKNFESEKQNWLSQEIKWGKSLDFDLIISDSSSLPHVLGVEWSIPSLFVGNFTWDFIYSGMKKYNPYFSLISEIIRVEYSFASAGLVLPFSCPIQGFLEKESLPLIGRRPRLSKGEARELFGFSKKKKIFLFSFGAYGLNNITWKWNHIPDDWDLVYSGAERFSRPEFRKLAVEHYPDLVTAADYVVTKPGYGILSEACFARTPILYTDRGEFAEYPYLVHHLETEIPSAFVSRTDLENLNFHSALEDIEKRNRSWREYPGQNETTLNLRQILSNYLN
jgi:hypothetical protein